MLTMFFNNDNLIIQGYNDQEVQIVAKTTIPVDSFKSYSCKENVSVNVPIDLN